jgi:hypothetical protein
MFLWGRWRHDMVAVGALLACVLVGLIPGQEAFAGFGHPAVITVACVLVLSRSLQTSGAIDVLTRRLMPTNAGPTVTIAALSAIGARAVRLHEQRRRAGAADAGRAPDRGTSRASRRARAHAAGLRLHPRRHDHPDRHAAESHRLRFPPKARARAASECSTSPRSAWPSPGPGFCSSPWSAGGWCPQGNASGRRIRHRRLHHRSPDSRGKQNHRQDAAGHRSGTPRGGRPCHRHGPQQLPRRRAQPGAALAGGGYPGGGGGTGFPHLRALGARPGPGGGA